MVLKQRQLPHLYAIGQPLFVTFCLYRSLPTSRPFPATNATGGQAFVAMDRLLHQVRSGPTFLRQPEIAHLVLDSIHYGAETGQYELHSWVIMPNHVHLLITPDVHPSRLLCSLKGATAKRANQLLGRTGQAFWQEESYDHLGRNAEESRRIRLYIENNPVTACLVATPEDYPWSSAGRPERPPQASGLPHF